MHGEGHRRRCPECGQEVAHITDTLSHRELRGPRNITSSNLDRFFDDNGRRFLAIEEKAPNEDISKGQGLMLRHLACVPMVDVWFVKGDPSELTVRRVTPPGSPLEAVASGDFATYQNAVADWFNSRPAPLAERQLAAWEGSQFDAPAWCPDDEWRAFDAALTRVVARRAASREAS